MQKLARDYLGELNRRHKKNRKALVAWILLATLVLRDFWEAGLFGHMKKAVRYSPQAIRKWISAIWIR